MKNFKNRRYLTIFTLLFYAAVCFSAHAYAAGNDMTSAKKAVEAQTLRFLRYVVRYNEKGMKSCIQPAKSVKEPEIYPQNSRQAKVIRPLQKKYFKYKIQRVSIKGKKASVRVKVRYYAGYEVMERSLLDFAGYMLHHPDPSDAETEKMLVRYEKKYIRKYGKKCVTDSNVSIPLVYRNGKWMISRVTGKMDDIMNCQLNTRSLDRISDKFS